jgi:putative oxidoreductase
MSPDTPIALGRVLLASLFVIGGIRHFWVLPVLTEALRARGVPFPRAAILFATLFEIAAGLSLALGVLVCWAALGLIAFTIAAGVLLLNFWDQQGELRTASIGYWQSNLALIGGLVLAAATASGQ